MCNVCGGDRLTADCPEDVPHLKYELMAAQAILERYENVTMAIEYKMTPEQIEAAKEYAYRQRAH
jgi:hypothetical protein